MHRNAVAVREAGAALGVEVEVHTHAESTRTADEAAAAVGCDVAQIVKSLVFTIDGELVLALVSGANRLEPGALATAAGGGDVARADAGAVRAATGFSIGGVPPFGHTQQLRTFVDRDLLAFGEVWAAAGTPNHVFPIDPTDLVRATDGLVADIGHR
jgi:Cys-tRNA(Pro) deacylase